MHKLNFFKIAIADLTKSKVVDTGATEAQTVATEAQTVATEEATVATEELVTAEGEGLVGAGEEAVGAVAGVAEGAVALGEGATVASGAVGVFGTVIVALTGPVGLAVIGIAAWGVALYEAYQHIPDFHNAIDTMAGSFVTLYKEVKLASPRYKRYWGASWGCAYRPLYSLAWIPHSSPRVGVNQETYSADAC